VERPHPPKPPLKNYTPNPNPTFEMKTATEKQKKARDAMKIASLRTERKIKPYGKKVTTVVYPKGLRKKTLTAELCKAMDEVGLEKPNCGMPKPKKKPAAKKAAAKKPAAKKPAAKKPAAKKSAAKRPVAKKTTSKKPVAKRPVAKKNTARKTTRKPAEKKNAFTKFLDKVEKKIFG
jgi:hypothetical protein